MSRSISSRPLSALRNTLAHCTSTARLPWFGRKHTVGSAFALALAITGCVDPLPESDTAEAWEEEPVAEGQSAITALGYASHQSSASAFPINVPVDLGPDNNRTCFLQGITGQFGHYLPAPAASARVFREGGHWWLQTTAGNGSGLKGFATCIPVTTNRHTLGWAGNTTQYPGKRWLGKDKVTDDTRCFLTEVYATTGFTAPGAYLSLKRETVTWSSETFSTWTLGGNLVLEADGDAGGRANAVCVDMPATVTPYTHVSPAKSNGTSITLAPIASKVCSVTGLKGNFAGAVAGINDGAKLFRSGDDWKAFSSWAKEIKGNCYGDP